MGPLGLQEMVVIFFVALLLFGPKKLPELGRTIAKAMTEFRRASNELKSTFDREMKTLEQEVDIKELKEAVNTYQYDTYNYDYSSYEGSNYDTNTYETSNYEYSSETASEVSNPSTPGASAPQGAESPAVVASNGESTAVPTNGHVPENTVPRGGLETHSESNGHSSPAEATEHKA